MKQCDVDDVFQTVFIKYAKGPVFESLEHEKAWLIWVIINDCNDVSKSRFRRNVDFE